MKKELNKYIESIKEDMVKIANKIFDNPEVGLKEYKASKLLCNYLEKNGFKVETGLATMDSAFRATYERGEGGPSFGLLCEYDAIEGLGHACGHHLQGPSIVATAVAIKEIIKEAPYKLVVYGTPAEETVGGKIKMVKEGFFRDIDIALMMHAGPNTTTDIKSLAMSKITVNFIGKSAHAAINPEKGRSALDALLLSFQGIEFMREHVADDVRMHYTVLDSGGPANVVPGRAVGSYYIRSYSNIYLQDAATRFKDIIKGAALMTGTQYEIKIDKEVSGKIPVLKLNDLLMENAKLVDAPAISPPREKTGSTDFGSVMYMIPGSCIRVAFVPEGTAAHSQEYLDSGKSIEAQEALIIGSKILASSIYDLITNKELLKDIQKEFEEEKVKSSIIA